MNTKSICYLCASYFPGIGTLGSKINDIVAAFLFLTSIWKILRKPLNRHSFFFLCLLYSASSHPRSCILQINGQFMSKSKRTSIAYQSAHSPVYAVRTSSSHPIQHSSPTQYSPSSPPSAAQSQSASPASAPPTAQPKQVWA